MKDYEQLYFDALYEIRKLKQEIELLKQQLEIYKFIQKDKNIKSIIIKDFAKYLNKKESE